jgi:O-methyltransferase domain
MVVGLGARGPGQQEHPCRRAQACHLICKRPRRSISTRPRSWGNRWTTWSWCPRGADAYLLGRILYDEDDAKALSSTTSHRAMPVGVKLLLGEYVAPEGDGASFGKWLDLQMVFLLGGRERTEPEYRRPLAAHGFRLARAVPTSDGVSVIEGRPARRS